MDVPPEICPGLSVVRGALPAASGFSVGRSASCAIPRLSSVMGFGVAASVHEWPPGPEIVTRNRRLPSARVTAAAVPDPSSATAAAIIPA